jgi:hypothetical protein
MFAKSKISQSMIDAVNQVLDESEKRLINDAELDETGFHKAAHAAKKAGQSHFEFQGKKYPATAKSHKEAIEIEEASEKVPTPTGMKVYGSSYGNSKKARADQTKHSVDDVKGPKAKELVGEDEDCVTKPQAKDIAKKEVKGHEKSMHKEQMSFADKLKASITEAKSTGTEEIFTDNNIGEMSDAQMKKREKIVMSMKKGEAGLKQRYGKNWKNVMYATATKQAMKEDSSEEFELDEADVTTDMLRGRVAGGKANDFKSYKVKLRGVAKNPEDDVKVPPTQTAASTPASLSIKSEEKEHDDEKEDKSLIKKMVKKDCMKEEEGVELDEAATRKDFQMVADLIRSHDSHDKRKELASHHAAIFHAQNPRFDHHKFMKACGVSHEVYGEETELDEATPAKGTDIADKSYLKTAGKKPGPLHNVGKGFKAFIQGKAEPKESVEMTGDQLDEEHGADAHFNNWMNSEHAPYKDDAGDDNKVHQMALNYLKHSDAPKDKHEMLARQIAHKFHGSSLEEKVIAGVGGWEKQKKDVTDKSGAVHTPMSRAKDLARQAFKKIKKETMMGKISN